MKLSIWEIVLFGMLGALMFVSKLLMELLPNIHLLDTFIIAFTVVYRQKALYPIYVFVFLNGLWAGFATWWVPYLYVWTVLWGVTMLLPRQMPTAVRPVAYMALGALHGFCFGTLCAPSQALFFGLNWQGTLAWIVSGLGFDMIHGISNFACGILICPLIALMNSLNRRMKTL